MPSPGSTSDFAAGEFVAILGPSGSGKSTLMHILGFMDTPSEGSIVFEGEEVGAARRGTAGPGTAQHRVGFVFQVLQPAPALTVLENVALPLLYREASRPRPPPPPPRRRPGARRDVASARPSTRPAVRRRTPAVAIARAIVGSPAIIFADEPTGNLDVRNVDLVLDLLGSLIQERHHRRAGHP
jgi:ABC-type lipoprotein export system ATPase subunit